MTVMTPIHLAIHDTLRLRQLKPNTKVNATLSALVESVIHSTEEELETLSNNHIQKVRRKAGRAESFMERHYAKQIVRSSNSKNALQLFPYLDNYQLLTQRELNLVQSSGLTINSYSRVLVIGSGPLPLTAYEIARQSGAQVDQVDSSRRAVSLGVSVGKALDFSSHYYRGYGQSVVIEQSYDLILVAALAGETTVAKQAIIDNVLPWLRPGGRIIVRSAHGARAVLYPIVGTLQNVTLLKTHHPDDTIINSILIYEAA